MTDRFRGDELKIFGDTVIVTANGVHIRAKSFGQQNYLDTMRHNVVTFGVGAAGELLYIARRKSFGRRCIG